MDVALKLKAKLVQIGKYKKYGRKKKKGENSEDPFDQSFNLEEEEEKNHIRHTN